MKSFDLYARVYVAASGGWKATFLGTVCSEAEPIKTMKGPENSTGSSSTNLRRMYPGLTFIGKPKF